MKRAVAIMLALVCARPGLAGDSAPVVAETLLADGSTNTWTQADLVDALGLLNRRYLRDVETEAGRRAWHGRLVSQTPSTNAAGLAVMRLAYADGFTWDEPFRAPAPKEAAKAALNARALLPTNGVSPRLAARRAETAAAPAAAATFEAVLATRPARRGAEVVRLVDAATGAVTGRVVTALRWTVLRDAYGVETNRAYAGRRETTVFPDGTRAVREWDADGNRVFRAPAAQNGGAK